MFEGGVTPSVLDHENYMELLSVLRARPREKRPLNADDAHKKIARMMGN